MTDAIEKMKEEGWKIHSGGEHSSIGIETITFERRMQKPNAIVDWQELESYLSDMETGSGFALSSHSPHLLVTLQSAASDIRRFIKKL